MTARSPSAAGSCRPATSSRSTATPARCSRAPSPARPRSCPRRGRCSPGRRSRGSASAMAMRRRGRRQRAAAPASRRGHAAMTCLRVIAHQGLRATRGHRRCCSLDEPEEVQPILDGLVADGLVAPAAGAYRLTRGGHDAQRSAARRGAGGMGHRQRAGCPRRVPRARRADEGHRHRLADPRPGRRALNDHSDVAYDRAVLDRLAALHGDASRLADAARGGLPEARRLPHSGSVAPRKRPQAGDGRFVASPRVDSYHGIWFELHEDLIQLAGRTRADEVAAGRA